jgi:hypothetical protein
MVKKIKKVVKKVVKPKAKSQVKPKAVKKPRAKKVKGVFGNVKPTPDTMELHQATGVPIRQLPVFDGKQILRVLSNPAPKGFVLCEAMDGETKVTIHVPKSLLV